MLIQTSLIQHITSIPNLLTIAVELGGIYLYFRESLLKLNNEVTYLKGEIKQLKDLSIKVVALESKIELINNDMKYLIKDFEKQEKTLSKISEEQTKTNQDIHSIKGSMLSIESYFKQIVEREG